VEDAIYEGKWLIALSAAGKFIGKLKTQDETGIRLEPVYDIVMTQMHQNGQPAVIRQLMPILLIPCDIGLGLAHDVALISVNELPDAERESWFSMVRNVRAGMQQLRAQRSGIVVPGH
jgi:hypothetical protein